MGKLRLILGDQLSQTISSLIDCDKQQDTILLCEVMEEASYVKHHKKKLVLIFSAMRHFANELREKGYQVLYRALDDKDNKGSLSAELGYLIEQQTFDGLVITQPSEYRVFEMIKVWQTQLRLPVDVRDDRRFLCTADEFSAWAKGRKQLRMEYFYREMRQRHAILMQDNKPIGGKWNYDRQNRKAFDYAVDIPKPYQCKPDKITQTVIQLVADTFADHIGDLTSFHFAVTRKQALRVLKHFIVQRLAFFGDYQDAMLENEPWMYHSHISFYLNCGLLLPMECIREVEKAYHDNAIPINAAEGFIRQVLGWREYTRGIYWLAMPDYAKQNFFKASHPLPSFYWTGKTTMNCLKQCIDTTIKHAYAHHIQRLMILGNFALLAAIEPSEVNAWYLMVYADAYEWVELPNVSGMVLFADGGYLASKPYAAGGNYINKMSNYCQHCHYDVKKKTGNDACPFNYLYWDFLARNKDKLSGNPRMAMIYKIYERMSDSNKRAITTSSYLFLKQLK